MAEENSGVAKKIERTFVQVPVTKEMRDELKKMAQDTGVPIAFRVRNHLVKELEDWKKSRPRAKSRKQTA